MIHQRDAETSSPTYHVRFECKIFRLPDYQADTAALPILMDNRADTDSQSHALISAHRHNERPLNDSALLLFYLITPQPKHYQWL